MNVDQPNKNTCIYACIYSYMKALKATYMYVHTCYVAHSFGVPHKQLTWKILVHQYMYCVYIMSLGVVVVLHVSLL